MHSRLYKHIMNSRQWKQLRLQVLTEQPLCRMCQEQGKVRAARCVHHIVEVETGRTDAECWEIALNRQNLVALCFECHGIVHREQRSHSKEAHRQRTEQRLEQWKERHTKGKSPRPSFL